MRGYVARKGRRWYAVVYQGVDPVTGRERRRWHPAGVDRDRAEQLARRLAADEAERRGDGRVRLTFGDFVDRYWWPAKQMRLRPTTLEGYERNLRLHILPALGEVVLRDLRAETIEALYGHLLLRGRADGSGGLSAKTVREVHVLIRSIYGDALRRGMVSVNPARYAAAPPHRRDPHRRRKTWTAAELRTFLEATSQHRHHSGFWLAANTGMRRSELLGLRWRDIDFSHQRLSIVRTVVCVGTKIEVSPGKTRTSARTIDLDPDTLEILAAWQASHHETFGDHDINRALFTKPDGQLLHPQSLSQTFDRAVASTDLPKITLHGLRHTHATLLLKEGIPLKVVSERLGHSTPAFTMATYQHVLPGMQSEAAATFAALLRPAAAKGRPTSTG